MSEQKSTPNRQTNLYQQALRRECFGLKQECDQLLQSIKFNLQSNNPQTAYETAIALKLKAQDLADKIALLKEVSK